MNTALQLAFYRVTLAPVQILAQASAPPPAAGNGLQWRWDKWLNFYGNDFTARAWVAARTLTTFGLLIICYWLLTRLFRRPLEKYRLKGATTVGAIATIVYITFFVWHLYLMVDPTDGIALVIHKCYAAILCLVAIRFVDRLVVVPILTRITGGTPSRFIHQIVVAVLSVFIIAGYCSWAFGIELGSLIAGSAVISIVLGLALQETLGNFFSGMVLQASVPFQTGDWIKIGDTEGRVVEMTWRAVTLITLSNNHILIPNSTVAKETITNYHTPSVATATNIAVGLEYALPPNEAKRVLIQAALETPRVLKDPAPSAALISFDDSAITYKVFFWINEPNQHGAIEQMVRTNLWYRLNQLGYNIPFPIRTVEMVDVARREADARQAAQLRRLNAIRNAALFARIAPELQDKLAAETREYPLAPGQTYFRQGDPGDSLYLLQEGTVAVSSVRDDGQEVPVDEITAPAVFGEVSAVTGQPRMATYRSKTDTRVVEIDRDHLQGLFSADPALVTHFSELVAQRQKERQEMLNKVGAFNAEQRAHNAESHNVLDRMRRLFTLRHH